MIATCRSPWWSLWRSRTAFLTLLGLRAAGYRVAVVTDACGSPPPNHEHGMLRLRDAGIMLTSLKMMFYEWTRGLETASRVKAELDPPFPSGLTF